MCPEWPAGRARAVLLAAGAAAVLGGCGVGPGESPDSPVSLTATREFGATEVLRKAAAKVSGADTVMRLTHRNAAVRTRFGGDFVQAISGVAGGRRAGRPVDWFIYVNGVLSDQGAGAVRVRGGDRIWWDHHDWGLTPDVPAVVGSFPQPFANGGAGKRQPVRVECDEPRSAPCAAIAGKLDEIGADAESGPVRPGAGGDSLRVLVGPWPRLRDGAVEAGNLDRGPKSSGVFARFDAAGTSLAVLDPRGRVARTLGAGSGLVAATREGDREPVWFVTGTDAAGVDAAARAFDEAALRDRFALALAGDVRVGVPLTAAGAAAGAGAGAGTTAGPSGAAADGAGGG